ncbi:uncharacterized protein BXZ73DRAFT_97597 [Epithele typhae]|uniref:uncharacterized protein n=1 Tax=Epithele typhae TaxID=378194 RepID=UPI00200793A3|nr:uncharacterized protein BXZ73DRAFT_97597 [Epithele typhae]KAH9942179.1 hypothetical protein BXZ73DRAFT_97597 [Epithele typhae]
MSDELKLLKYRMVTTPFEVVLKKLLSSTDGLDLLMADTTFKPPEEVRATEEMVGVLDEVRAKLYSTIKSSAAIDHIVCVSHRLAQPDAADPTTAPTDLALYYSDDHPEPGAPTSWSQVELLIELRDRDPFDLAAPDADPTTLLAAYRRSEACAREIFAHQQRRDVYTVVAFGTSARVVHWDHSGFETTEPVAHARLARFVRLYSRLGAAARGHDPSARAVARDSPAAHFMRLCAAVARAAPDDPAPDVAAAAFAASLADPRARWWGLRVGEDRVFVGEPHYVSRNLFRGGTCGYVGVHVRAGEAAPGGGGWRPRFVYVKDTYRVVDREGALREGDVLDALNVRVVGNVPTLVCHGDVGWRATSMAAAWVRRHYRLATEEVCVLVEDGFENTAGLLQAFEKLVGAHEVALGMKLLHGNVSPDNMMLWKKSSKKDGVRCYEYIPILGDWSTTARLGLKHNEAMESDEQHSGYVHDIPIRFAAARRFTQPHFAGPKVSDDLESFVHSLLYLLLRHAPSNLFGPSLDDFMRRYFEPGYLHDSHFRAGGRYSQAVPAPAVRGALRTSIVHGEQGIVVRRKGGCQVLLRFHLPGAPSQAHPVDAVVHALLQSLRAAYRAAGYGAGGSFRRPNGRFDVGKFTAAMELASHQYQPNILTNAHPPAA